VGLGLWLAGCVVIPYEPKPEAGQELVESPHFELIRLSVGPRQFLAELSTEIRKADPRLEPVDGQSFIDAAAPDGELTLAALLDPASKTRIESPVADFLVLFREPEEQVVDTFGEVITELGVWGLGKVTHTWSYWAALVDLRQLELEQLSWTATGTDRSVGMLYGLAILSETQRAARKGLVGDLVGRIASARPEGPVRVVFLASEAIRTAEDIAAEERAARRMRWFAPWSLETYPAYSELPPLQADEGLIFLYRRDHAGYGVPITVRQRSAAGEFEIVRLWSAGYLPFVLPAGPVELWVETDPTRVATLDVAPGDVYYVHATYCCMFKESLRLEVVDRAKGQRGVERCRQLPTTSEYIAQVHLAAELGYTHKQLELAGLYAQGVADGLGKGLVQDEFEAYKWYSIVIATDGTRREWQSQAERSRESVAAHLTSDEVLEATRLAAEWLAASREVQ
jgi:hypothetical protein